MKLIFQCISLFLLIGLKGISQNTEEFETSRILYPEVKIPNTELRTLHSQILDQDLNLYIKLPLNYYTNTDEIYPVWYCTDANRAFPLVANAVSVLEFPVTDFPEIIVIGIGYQIKDLADWAAWRTRDLTPTNDKAVDEYWNDLLVGMTGRTFDIRSGGAALFLEFIIKELMPFAESNYRISYSDRGLGGYSYGGLFVLYTLFSHPETFNRYFAGSPSLEWDNGILFQYENEFSLTHTYLNAMVFLSAGELENDGTKDNIDKMVAKLRSRNYRGLSLQTNVFPGESHRSCYPSAVMRAFKVLYSK
jgi:uncharacterized protein